MDVNVVLIPVTAAVSVLAVTGLVRWGWKAVRHQVTSDLGDALQNRWEAALQPLYDELKFNGGQSVKDKIWSIDARLHNVEQQLEIRHVNGDDIEGHPI